MSNLQQKL